MKIWSARARRKFLIFMFIIAFIFAPIRPINQYKGQFGYEGAALKPNSFWWKSITFHTAYGYSLDYHVDDETTLYIFTETQFINFNETRDTTCIQSHFISGWSGVIDISLPRHGTYFLIFRNESAEEQRFVGEFFIMHKERVPILSYVFPFLYFNI